MTADINITAEYTELPSIVTQPLDVDILSGQNTVLSVVATGDSLNYQWYLGCSGDTSNPIAGATSSPSGPGPVPPPDLSRVLDATAAGS